MESLADFGNTIRVVQSTFALLRPSLTNHADAMSLLNDADRSLKGARDLIQRLLASRGVRNSGPS